MRITNLFLQKFGRLPLKAEFQCISLQFGIRVEDNCSWHSIEPPRRSLLDTKNIIEPNHEETCFCIICESKGAGQRLCFNYTDSRIPILRNLIRHFKHLAIFCGCTARFVSDLVGNPEDRLSRDAAQIYMFYREQYHSIKSSL